MNRPALLARRARILALLARGCFLPDARSLALLMLAQVDRQLAATR